MLVRTQTGGTLKLHFNGQIVAAREGDTVAVALLAACVSTTRITARRGRPRGPYCLMGACFECLATVDGVANVQTCLTPVRDGMQVQTQNGAPLLATQSTEPQA